MRIKVTTHAPHMGPRADTSPMGPGTRLQKFIHRVVDASPLPETAKKAIKGCGGCARRAERLNSAGQAMRMMLAAHKQPPKNHGP